MPIMLACNISADIPDTYQIAFSITSSTGLSSSVNRTLTILPSCPPGEIVCSGKASHQRPGRLHLAAPAIVHIAGFCHHILSF